jgi:thiamine pyrophosphate-dependent acetolactate synthase large subunit-like protein
VGATPFTLSGPATAVAEATEAYRRAAVDGATVVLNLPLDVQDADVPDLGCRPALPLPVVRPASAGRDAVAELAGLLAGAARPVFIGGRGARWCADELAAAADACGALLASTAAARGLFAGSPWDLDVAGGFSTETTTGLIAAADVVVAWGASLNVWTARHGALFGEGVTLVQVDRDVEALGAQRPVGLGLVGDVAETAAALTAELAARGHAAAGYRTDDVRARIAAGAHWRDVPYDDTGDDAHIDPRTLTLALDELLPAERVVVTDLGNFSAYPQLFPRVPDVRGACLPIGFGSIGLGLSAAIGAALAQPDRLVMAGLGDGGFMMSSVELDTAARLGLGLLLVVYNDDAYGAESQMFGPEGHPVDIVVFPDTDLAAIARGHGCDAVTVRTAADLDAVAGWLTGPRDRPLLVDAKITSFPSFVMDQIHAAGM